MNEIVTAFKIALLGFDLEDPSPQLIIFSKNCPPIPKSPLGKKSDNDEANKNDPQRNAYHAKSVIIQHSSSYHARLGSKHRVNEGGIKSTSLTPLRKAPDGRAAREGVVSS